MAQTENFIPDARKTEGAKTLEETHIFDRIAEPNLLKTLIQDDIYVLGGQFAILCQFAHPALAKGSYKHSNFASRIMDRLQNTSRFLNAAVYGSLEEQRAIFSVIHRYHALVKGDDYDANDPELHKWTAATLFVSMVLVRETFFGKLSHDEMNRLFRESAIFGTSLRMPPGMWPATLDDFWIYWNHNIATLKITDEARSLGKDLLYPTQIPLWFRLQSPIARLLTAHWLPERLAREYGLETTPLSRAAYHAIVGWTCATYPHLPEGFRTRQHRHYMKDFKRAVERITATGHWANL